MQGNSSLQTLRNELYSLIQEHCKIAFLFTSAANRKNLGKEALVAMRDIFLKNGLTPENSAAYFDEGLFSSVHFAKSEINKLSELTHLHFYPEQDSKACLGIQLADAAANSMAQVIREELTDKFKFIDIGGENTGYPDGTEAELGWTLLMGVRYCFFTRPVLPHGHDYDPKTQPLIYADNEDPVDISINPELIGWGIHLGGDVSKNVKEVVEKKFSRIWLGCIH